MIVFRFQKSSLAQMVFVNGIQDKQAVTIENVNKSFAFCLVVSRFWICAHGCERNRVCFSLILAKFYP